MQPYLQWVRAHAQKLGMPYEAILPVIVEPTNEEGIPYIVLYPYMPSDPGELLEVLDSAKRGEGYLPGKVPWARKEDLEAHQATREWKDDQWLRQHEGEASMGFLIFCFL